MPVVSEDAPLKQAPKRGRGWFYAFLLVPLSGVLLVGQSTTRPQRIGPLVLSTEFAWQANPGYRVSSTAVRKGSVTGPIQGGWYRSTGEGIFLWGWIGHFRYVVHLLQGHPVAPDAW